MNFINSNIHAIKLLISLPIWWLIFKITETALLRSKQPIWLNLYSTQKFLFIISGIVLCYLLYFFLKKLKIDNNNILLAHIKLHNYRLYFVVSTILSIIPFLNNGVSIGEDLGGQIKSTLQWYDGKVSSPNLLLEPNQHNLSEDKVNWSLRPIGAALLPLPGMLLGFTIGSSVKIGIFCCMLTGGWCWLILFNRHKINNIYMCIVALLFGFSSGIAVTQYSTANVILYALTPMFIIWARSISNDYENSKQPVILHLKIFAFLFLLGSFALVKLSGLIVAGTIGAYLFFTVLLKLKNPKSYLFVLIFCLLGIFFWTPYLLLEKINLELTGITANDLYNANDSTIQEPLFGKFWGESTNGFWLFWSFLSSPGYALPIKGIAHGLRDLVMQFPTYVNLIHSYKINIHVFISGGLGIVLSLFLFQESLKSSKSINSDLKVLLFSFLIIPFVGLSILSTKYEWNYLLYHVHTYEYWIIFLLPVLINLSTKNISTKTIILFGITLALPLTTCIETCLNKCISTEHSFVSTTEDRRGLSGNRFSEAIEYVENNSTSQNDILFFLPVGDMADLTLRTKLRTMAKHFAGDNFPKSGIYKSEFSLNVFCVYDANLVSNESFQKALDLNFPQQVKRTMFRANKIIVEKLLLQSSN